jgi:hypothetical protein
VQLSSPTVVADGSSTVTATATVTDSGASAVPGDTVTITSSDPGETISPSPANDNGDGTYTATITSSKKSGPVTITATDSSGPSGTAQLTQTPGPAASLSVALAPSTIIANGSSTATATATLTDANGNPVPGDAVTFSSSDSGEAIGPVTDNGNGTYSATVTSSTTVGSVTITGTDSTVSPHPSGQATLTQEADSTTAMLPASPSTAVTNQAVTLIATVTASAGVPSGAVAFELGSTPLAGCASVTVDTSVSTGVATCQASFAASTSPEHLSAVFAPSNPASLVGSASTPTSLAVGQAATTAMLQVSSENLTVGASATYTATVVPGYGGATEPSGSVEFLDGGTPIRACAGQPLTTAATPLSATCTVTYKATGKHTINARYLGDANFSASSTLPQPVTVSPKAVTVLKSVSATMRWSFLHSASYTKVLSLVVSRAPSGGRVISSCNGHGCPYRQRVITVANPKPCKSTASRHCAPPPPGTLDLTPPFRDRRLAVGTRLVIEVARSGRVGKYYEFTMDARSAPSVQIACLAPGGSKPGVGC